MTKEDFNARPIRKIFVIIHSCKRAHWSHAKIADSFGIHEKEISYLLKLERDCVGNPNGEAILNEIDEKWLKWRPVYKCLAKCKGNGEVDDAMSALLAEAKARRLTDKPPARGSTRPGKPDGRRDRWLGR
jgi:hypothetical protein